MSIGKLYHAFGTATLIWQADGSVMRPSAALEAQAKLRPADPRKIG